MKALVALDSNGHFRVVLIKDDESHLSVLREIAQQISSIHYLDDQTRAEAYRLAHEGSIDEIDEWLNEGEYGMGRTGGSRYDIVESGSLPERFVQDVFL